MKAMGKQIMHRPGKKSHTFDRMIAVLRKQSCSTEVKNKTDNLPELERIFRY